MREIKFRAWDTKGKKMRWVEEVSFEKDGSIHGLLSGEKGETIGRVYLGEPTQVDVGNKNYLEGWLDDFPLMQYTGLKDSTKWEQLTPKEQAAWLKSGKTQEEWNGKEIYEGDITKDGVGNIDTIIFHPSGYFAIERGIDHTWIDGNRIRVIGNIYGDAELLEKNERE